MAWRLASALLAVAALAACSSTSSMYAGDPYSVSSSRNPGSFSEAFGSPKLPMRYQSGGTLDEIYGSSAAMARASLVPPLEEKRKIAEQDCSKPVILDEGNLRCK
jgi:hypothetical protein